MELRVIVIEMDVEISVGMVMLKGLNLLVFLSIPNLLLFLLLIINLNLLFQLPLFPLITSRYTIIISSSSIITSSYTLYNLSL